MAHDDALTEANWAKHIRTVPGPTNDSWADALSHAEGNVDETVTRIAEVEAEQQAENSEPLTEDNIDESTDAAGEAGPASAALAENPSDDAAGVIQADNADRAAEANADTTNAPADSDDDDDADTAAKKPGRRRKNS